MKLTLAAQRYLCRLVERGGYAAVHELRHDGAVTNELVARELISAVNPGCYSVTHLGRRTADRVFRTGE
ncbi:MAG: hypothetical protein WC505_07660 [Patescibacteria group bacterium]